MQGSFDNPPIVIHTSKKACLLIAAGCVLFVAFRAYQFWQTAWPLSFWPYVPLLVAAMVGLLWGVQAISPSRLDLTPDGLTYTGLFGRKLEWPWSETYSFRALEWGMIAIELMSGGTSGFMGPWEGGGDALVDTLTAARTKWGDPED
jgi:hypothetical protein